MGWAKRGYAPLLDWAMLNKPLTLTLTAVSVVLSGLLVTRMGSEFIPPQPQRGRHRPSCPCIPGTSLTQAIEMQLELERTIKQFPEVERVFAKMGTAEIATDPCRPASPTTS